MSKATDFQNVATDMRVTMLNVSQVDADFKAANDFYNANLADSYWVALGADDQIGDSGITKAQFISAITFFQQWSNFLGNIAVVTGDYRATVEQVRATR